MSKTQVQEVYTGYKPRPFQKFLHTKLKRFNVLVCHRRFGKTVFSINEMIHQGLTNTKHNPQYAYIAPTYKQAKMIAWEYFKDYTRDIPGVEFNKSELTVTINRKGIKDRNGAWKKKPDAIKFILLGADNPDALRGIYLDGGIIDEFAQCDPILWGEIVRPALADRGGWIIFIGTPKGQNHFYHRFIKAQENSNWYSVIFKASETGVLSQNELDDIKMDLTDAEYQQEMECSFTANILGSYYGKWINELDNKGKIGDYPYDPAYPVDTFWDLGIGDCLTIWFRQKLPGTFRYIDYLEVNSKSLPEVAKIVKEKVYIYGRHVIPWDGKTRELGTGLTRQETLRKLGIKTQVQKRQTVDDRIQASRNLLPISTFDRQNCARGIECLRNYQKEWDSKLMMFKPRPKHDWSSHGADSYGYSALDTRESYFGDSYRDELPRECQSDYDELGGNYE